MADNPFVSLDPVPAQVVTIRPMHEPGLPGTPAPHVKIQYSVDGVTNWHDAPTSEDKYFRRSTDDGATGGGAVYCGNTADAEIARIAAEAAQSAAEAARDKAAAWAESPEDVEVEIGQFSALHHKEKAIDAQIAAEAAQSAAATSETNAAASATNAATSETNAATSETNAATSATNAAASATNAATSETNALASENKAHKWAENPENLEVEDGKYSALHHATKAAMSEMNAEAAALDAAGAAAEAFGATAPAWESGVTYNYNDVVSYINGHTYRCIGTDVTTPPNIGGNDDETNWTRITVSVEYVFELDENGDLMPKITVWGNDTWELDENFDIMPREVA
jgi:hypothetical protein